MCHQSVLTWAASALTPNHITGLDVLEVGSYNVNGTVRPLIQRHAPKSYLGVDATPGPGVDLVLNVDALAGEFDPVFGLVVSTEMLEHVRGWRTALANLIQVVAPGGVLAVTTRSPGFPYHPFPEDHWRYPPETMGKLLESAGMLLEAVHPDPEAPGVFAVARKPADWAAPLEWFPGMEVDRV